MADLMPVAEMVEETARWHSIDEATATQLVERYGKQVAKAHGDRWPFAGGGGDAYVHPTWLVGLRRAIDWHFHELRVQDEVERPLREAAARVAAAEKALADARWERDEVIRAIGEELPVARIAALTQLHRQRIYQIRDQND